MDYKESVTEILDKFKTWEAENKKIFDEINEEERQFYAAQESDNEKTATGSTSGMVSAENLTLQEVIARNADLLKRVENAKAILRSRTTYSPTEGVLKRTLANFYQSQKMSAENHATKKFELPRIVKPRTPDSESVPVLLDHESAKATQIVMDTNTLSKKVSFDLPEMDEEQQQPLEVNSQTFQKYEEILRELQQMCQEYERKLKTLEECGDDLLKYQEFKRKFEELMKTHEDYEKKRQTFEDKQRLNERMYQEHKMMFEEQREKYFGYESRHKENKELVESPAELSESYEEFSENYKEHGNVYEEIGSVFEAIGNKSEAKAKKFDAFGNKFVGVENEFGEFGNKYGAKVNKFKEFSNKFNGVENKFQEFGIKHQAVGNKYEVVGNKYEAVGNKYEVVVNEHEAIGNKYEAVGNKYEDVWHKHKVGGNKDEVVEKHNKDKLAANICGELDFKYKEVSKNSIKHDEQTNNHAKKHEGVSNKFEAPGRNHKKLCNMYEQIENKYEAVRNKYEEKPQNLREQHRRHEKLYSEHEKYNEDYEDKEIQKWALKHAEYGSKFEAFSRKQENHASNSEKHAPKLQDYNRYQVKSNRDQKEYFDMQQDCIYKKVENEPLQSNISGMQRARQHEFENKSTTYQDNKNQPEENANKKSKYQRERNVLREQKENRMQDYQEYQKTFQIKMDGRKQRQQDDVQKRFQKMQEKENELQQQKKEQLHKPYEAYFKEHQSEKEKWHHYNKNQGILKNKQKTQQKQKKKNKKEYDELLEYYNDRIDSAREHIRKVRKLRAKKSFLYKFFKKITAEPLPSSKQEFFRAPGRFYIDTIENVERARESLFHHQEKRPKRVMISKGNVRSIGHNKSVGGIKQCSATSLKLHRASSFLKRDPKTGEAIMGSSMRTIGQKTMLYYKKRHTIEDPMDFGQQREETERESANQKRAARLAKLYEGIEDPMDFGQQREETERESANQKRAARLAKLYEGSKTLKANIFRNTLAASDYSDFSSQSSSESFDSCEFQEENLRAANILECSEQVVMQKSSNHKPSKITAAPNLILDVRKAPKSAPSGLLHAKERPMRAVHFLDEDEMYEKDIFKNYKQTKMMSSNNYIVEQESVKGVTNIKSNTKSKEQPMRAVHFKNKHCAQAENIFKNSHQTEIKASTKNVAKRESIQYVQNIKAAGGANTESEDHSMRDVHFLGEQEKNICKNFEQIKLKTHRRDVTLGRESKARKKLFTEARTEYPLQTLYEPYKHQPTGVEEEITSKYFEQAPNTFGTDYLLPNKHDLNEQHPTYGLEENIFKYPKEAKNKLSRMCMVERENEAAVRSFKEDLLQEVYTENANKYQSGAKHEGKAFKNVEQSKFRAISRDRESKKVVISADSKAREEFCKEATAPNVSKAWTEHFEEVSTLHGKGTYQLNETQTANTSDATEIQSSMSPSSQTSTVSEDPITLTGPCAEVVPMVEVTMAGILKQGTEILGVQKETLNLVSICISKTQFTADQAARSSASLNRSNNSNISKTQFTADQAARGSASLNKSNESNMSTVSTITEETATAPKSAHRDEDVDSLASSRSVSSKFKRSSSAKTKNNQTIRPKTDAQKILLLNSHCTENAENSTCEFLNLCLLSSTFASNVEAKQVTEQSVDNLFCQSLQTSLSKSTDVLKEPSQNVRSAQNSERSEHHKELQRIDDRMITPSKQRLGSAGNNESVQYPLCEVSIETNTIEADNNNVQGGLMLTNFMHSTGYHVNSFSEGLGRMMLFQNTVTEEDSDTVVSSIFDSDAESDKIGRSMPDKIIQQMPCCDTGKKLPPQSEDAAEETEKSLQIVHINEDADKTNNEVPSNSNSHQVNSLEHSDIGEYISGTPPSQTREVRLKNIKKKRAVRPIKQQIRSLSESEKSEKAHFSKAIKTRQQPSEQTKSSERTVQSDEIYKSYKANWNDPLKCLQHLSYHSPFFFSSTTYSSRASRQFTSFKNSTYYSALSENSWETVVSTNSSKSLKSEDFTKAKPTSKAARIKGATMNFFTNLKHPFRKKST